ncbi:MAG: hypothetical protein WAV46_04835 [Candidatus Moraniibacteriota bacterium]
MRYEKALNRVASRAFLSHGCFLPPKSIGDAIHDIAVAQPPSEAGAENEQGKDRDDGNDYEDDGNGNGDEVKNSGKTPEERNLPALHGDCENRGVAIEISKHEGSSLVVVSFLLSI